MASVSCNPSPGVNAGTSGDHVRVAMVCLMTVVVCLWVGSGEWWHLYCNALRDIHMNAISDAC